MFGFGKLAFLFVTIILYKGLSISEVGYFAAAYAIAVILSTMSECGLRGLLVRELARSRDSAETSTKLLGGAINARLATLLPYLGLGFVAGVIFLPQVDGLVLFLLLMAAWLDSNAFVFRGAIRAYNYVLTDAAIAGTSRFVLLLVTAGLFWQQKLTLANFSFVFVIVAALDLLLTLTINGLLTGIKPTFTTTKERTIAMIRRGLPFIVLNIVGILYMRVAVLLLGMSHGAGSLDEVAGFNLSGRIPEGVSFLPIALMNAAIPFFSRNSKSTEKIMPVFRELETVLGCAGIMISTGLVVFAEPLILLLATPEYLHFKLVFQLYGVSVFLTFLQYVFANLLICMDQEKRVATRYGIVLVVNIILNSIVIWHFGSFGAVCVLLVCELLAIAIDLKYLTQSGIRISVRIFFTWVIALAFCSVAALLLSKLPNQSGFYIYWLCGGICGMVLLLKSKFLAQTFSAS